MAELINNFSWSISRSDTFDYCKRKYFLNYYDSWGGWEWNAPARRKLIYFLKKKQFSEMWVGDVLHKAIRYAITNRGTIDETRLIDILKRRLDKDYTTSQAFTKNTAKPKDLWLFEHYKERDIDLPALTDKAILCIKNYFQSHVYKELMEADYYDLIYLDNPDLDQMQFNFNGTVVFAIPDLCYRNKVGHIVLIDWKTGKAPEAELTPQLQLYSLRLLLHDQWRPDEKEIYAYSVYLQDGTVKGRKITNQDLTDICAKADASIIEMNTLLVNADANHPKPAVEFPKTEHTKKCGSCVFEEVCDQDDF